MRELVIAKLKEIKADYKSARYLTRFVIIPEELDKMSDQELLDGLLNAARWLG